MARSLSLAGPLAKVQRANERIDQLKAEFSRLRSEFYELLPEHKLYAQKARRLVFTEQQFREFRLAGAPGGWGPDGRFYIGVMAQYHVVRVRTKALPPYVAWGVLVGEIVSLLRSALDNLVWELSELQSGPYSGPIPIPRNSPWRLVGFPVRSSLRPNPNQNAWTEVCGNELGLIRPALRRRFKALQPGHRRKYPDRYWLWRLHELWNRDKHHGVTFTENKLGQFSLTFKSGPAGDPAACTQADFGRHFAARLFWPHKTLAGKPHLVQIGPPETETDVMRYWVRERIPRYFREKIEMEVHSRIAGAVFFEDRSPGFGADVIQTLEGFSDRVAAVLADFEPEFR